MEIKGTSLSNISKYIKKHHPNNYEIWIDELPDASKKIFNDIILVSKWFDLTDGYINPVKVAGKLFFDNNIEKAAYEISKHSSIVSLNGVYKIFVKIASIDFVFKRAVNIFKTFYSDEANLIVEKPTDKTLFLKVTGFEKGEELIFDGISGWADGILRKIYNYKKNNFSTRKKNNWRNKH